MKKFGKRPRMSCRSASNRSSNENLAEVRRCCGKNGWPNRSGLEAGASGEPGNPVSRASSGAMREWSSHAKPGYPVNFGDATAGGTALAFLISRPHGFRTLLPPSTPCPARCQAIARMRASNSSRRRMSACHSGSAIPNSPGASIATSIRSRCPALLRLPSAVAANAR